ncbi:trigger factor [Desulfovibrio inopinatus]|uniref:trigger factor n=1 Tax=Desulfovibrio inopinatus TaxID=102109 RepID=UPI0003FE2399|nr:trigger factor [Desulfovibrio inopinatus]
MEYTTTEVSPVEVKVRVEVPAEEVNASLSATIAMLRAQVDIKGFRKGKVPASVIEARFKDQVYGEATNDLINVHINEVMGELNLTPLSKIDVDAKELVKGEPFSYTFGFEHAPEIELPEYKGLDVEETEADIEEKDIDAIIERLRSNNAEVQVIKEERTPVDGDVIVVSFEAFKDGESVPGIKADNFEMTLGEGQALADFETMVKALVPGQEGGGDMTFPEDFINQNLAGHTVEMKVKLHVIKEKVLPEVDDELAKKAGNFESLEKMKEVLKQSYVKSRQELYKSEAEKKLLDKLLKMVDFPLPQGVLEETIKNMIDDYIDRLERSGKNPEKLGKDDESVRAEVAPQAEELLRSQLLLMSLAQKENLTVQPQEVDAYLYQVASKTGQDFLTIKQYYERENLIFQIKDKILSDKAMDFLYRHANVTKVPASEAPAQEEESEGQDG